MRRDFTTATEEHLKELVKEADEKLCPFTDGLGDIGLSILDGIGLLKAINDADGYHRAVFDMNNTSLEELQKIFADVRGIDETYAATFRTHVEAILQIHDEIKKKADIVISKSSYAAATEGASDLILQKEFQSEYTTNRQMQDEIFALLEEERFSKEVWNSLTPEKRVERLEEFYNEVQRIMGTHAEGISFSEISESQFPNGAGAFYDPKENTVTINSDYLTVEHYQYLYQSVIHELRHCYQWETIVDPSSHVVSERTRQAWKDNYLDYYGLRSGESDLSRCVSQPIEFDSISFARQYSFINLAKPTYRGSWVE